jgi:hypothetical protein
MFLHVSQISAVPLLSPHAPGAILHINIPSRVHEARIGLIFVYFPRRSVNIKAVIYITTKLHSIHLMTQFSLAMTSLEFYLLPFTFYL